MRGQSTTCRVATAPAYNSWSRDKLRSPPQTGGISKAEILTVNIQFPGSDQSFPAIIDCGSYHSHLDLNTAHQLGVPFFRLTQPITVLGFDGQPAGTSAAWANWNFKIGNIAISGGKWLISSITGQNRIILGYDFLA